MSLDGTTVLLIYIFFLVPLMLLGFYFARRKLFNPQHKIVMTAVVILNWVLIAALMANSYRSVVEFTPDRGDINFILPTVHLITGAVAQLMATYLVLLMWTENTALERIVLFRIKNIKTPMRLTLSLWLVTVVLGFGIYALFNAPTAVAEDTPSPAVMTEEALPIEEDAAEDTPAPDATEEVEEAPEDPGATEEAQIAPSATEED